MRHDPAATRVGLVHILTFVQIIAVLLWVTRALRCAAVRSTKYISNQDESCRNTHRFNDASSRHCGQSASACHKVYLTHTVWPALKTAQPQLQRVRWAMGTMLVGWTVRCSCIRDSREQTHCPVLFICQTACSRFINASSAISTCISFRRLYQCQNHDEHGTAQGNRAVLRCHLNG